LNSKSQNLRMKSVWKTTPVEVTRGLQCRLARRSLLILGLSLYFYFFSPQPSILAAEVTKITLWHGVNPPQNRVVLQRLVNSFNQTHADIQVEALYIGQPDQQLPKILAAIVGNATPDLLWYAPNLTGQLVELNALRPLEDWLNNSAIAQSLDPNLFESMELEEHLWSIPFGTNNVGVYYRPSLFKAAGIEQLPQTWDEFQQVAGRLTRDTNGDRRIDQHGILLPLGKGEWTVFMWLPFMWSAGGELQTNGEIELVNPGAIAALDLWRNLLESGAAILSAPERGYELDGFVAGKVAMQLSGPWTLAQLQATGVDFGVLPIPAKTRKATAIGGENLFLFKTTPAREQAAQTFLEYVLSEPFQTQWAIGTGYLPVNLQARQNPDYRAFREQTPAVDVFLEQATVGRSRPIIAGYRRLSESLGRAIEAVLLRQGPPVEALNRAQQRLQMTLQP